MSIEWHQRISSNGPIAWTVAALAIGVILALPVKAAAQNSSSRTAGAGATSASGSSGTRRTTLLRGNAIDFFDYVDAYHTANMMMAEPSQAQGAGAPMNAGQVVCLAGCDKGNGSVVYQEKQRATLASLSMPTLNPRAVPVGETPSVSIQGPSVQVVTCLAGCYEQAPTRTVASLRSDIAGATLPQSTPRRAQQAPVLAAAGLSLVPSTASRRPPRGSHVAKAASRRAIPSRGRLASTNKADNRRNARQDYGKIIVLPATKSPPAIAAATEAPAPVRAPAPTPAPAPIVAAAPVGDAEVGPPVTTFAPQKTPERKRSDRAQPSVTVSTDWFNKLKRQQQDPANARALAQ